MLLALDPGMNSPGVALFAPHPRGEPFPVLVAAARVSIPRDLALEDAGQRWFYVARHIHRWFADQKCSSEHLVVAFEKPQWYARTKSKGDPNDLVGVAGVAAALCGLLQPAKILSPEPAVWIGQLPKVCPVCKGKAKKKCTACLGSAWKTPRGKRIMSRLTPAEIALVPDQNDAIDSAGIGLWACGRLERVSVFSNGNDGR